MAINYGEDYGYANERLSGSVVLLENNPVMIGNVNGRGVTSYSKSRFEEAHLTAHLRDFDLTPLRLGFMNRDMQAEYVQRLPARVYKQGLREGVLTKRIDLFSTCFVNCIQNKYPDVERVLDTLMNDEAYSVAFSRKFSLEKPRRGERLVLKYKHKVVGSFNPKEKVPEFNPDFMFLKDVYERAVA